MKENMYEKNNEQTTTKVLSIPKDLPELSDSNVEFAQSHNSLSWAHSFMIERKSGQTHWLNDVGIHLQKVDDNVVRCIAVVSHPYCFANLNMLKLTFETANMRLEVEPYTLVIPYTPKEKNSSEEGPGLEVV
jgi:hypothetical protein